MRTAAECLLLSLIACLLGAGCASAARRPAPALSPAAAVNEPAGSYAVAITKRGGRIVINSVNGSRLVEPAAPDLQVIVDFIRDASELYAVTQSPDLEEIALLREGQSIVLDFRVDGGQVTIDRRL